VTGDFAPDRSDLDLLGVLADDPDEARLRRGGGLRRGRGGVRPVAGADGPALARRSGVDIVYLT
jgi:hypothetical protein